MGLAIIFPNVDFRSANLGKVTLTEDVELQSLSIVGESTVVGTEAMYSVNYTPENTNQRGVVWSIVSGGEYSSIDSSTGKLTVRSGAQSSVVVIKATSAKNSAIYAEKSISVSYPKDESEYDYDGILDTNGGAYITDYIPEIGDTIEYYFRTPSSIANAVIAMGSRDSVYSDNNSVMIDLREKSSNYKMVCKAFGVKVEIYEAVADTDYLFVFNDKEVSVNGVIIPREGASYTFSEPSVKVGIGQLNTGDRGLSVDWPTANHYLYYFKVTRGGEVIAYYTGAEGGTLVDKVTGNMYQASIGNPTFTER